jgi:hypothetical protein
LSSQHPYINNIAWAHFYRYESDLIDLQEAIDLLSPDRVFYVPHDLAFPIKDEEVLALKAVTAALMPSDAFWYLRRITNVFNVGWIGNLKPEGPQTAPTSAGIAFLPSEIGYYRDLGPDYFIHIFESIWPLKPTVKFPLMDGIEIFEDALRDLGIDVLPMRSSAAQLIDSSSIVLANGLSSIIFEAHSRGRQTICLMDASQPEKLQRQHFAALDGLKLLPIEKAADYVRSLGAYTLTTPDEAMSPPFDYDLVYRLLADRSL